MPRHALFPRTAICLFRHIYQPLGHYATSTIKYHRLFSVLYNLLGYHPKRLLPFTTLSPSLRTRSTPILGELYLYATLAHIWYYVRATPHLPIELRHTHLHLFYVPLVSGRAYKTPHVGVYGGIATSRFRQAFAPHAPTHSHRTLPFLNSELHTRDTEYIYDRLK